MRIWVRVVLISVDDALGVTGTEIADLEYRSIWGGDSWVAKYENIRRLEILMPSGIVRQHIDTLTGNLHYFRAVVQIF
jgi:hypothetical protein